MGNKKDLTIIKLGLIIIGIPTLIAITGSMISDKVEKIIPQYAGSIILIGMILGFLYLFYKLAIPIFCEAIFQNQRLIYRLLTCIIIITLLALPFKIYQITDSQNTFIIMLWLCWGLLTLSLIYGIIIILTGNASSLGKRKATINKKKKREKIKEKNIEVEINKTQDNNIQTKDIKKEWIDEMITKKEKEKTEENYKEYIRKNKKKIEKKYNIKIDE